MNLDLFSDADRASPLAYRQALQGWLADAGRSGSLQRDSSVEVYEHMWTALSAWAVGEGVGLDALDASDPEGYLGARGGGDEVSGR